MRHRVYGRHLSRSKNQRTALFKGLVQSLILSEQIQTTEAKAKAIKGVVDKIITQAKSPATRRLVWQFLIKKEAQEKLIKEIVPRFGSRNSGFTSVTRLGKRKGDGAMMVSMRLLLEAREAGEKVSKKSKESKESKESKVKEIPVTSKPASTSRKGKAKK